MTERERQALAASDHLNSILMHSSIPSGTHSATLRAREQAAMRLQADRQAQDYEDMMLGMAVRSREGQLNRDAAQQRAETMAESLSTPELRDSRNQAQTFTQLGSAVEAGQSVLERGGNFAGLPHVAISALRDWELTGAADLLSQMAYNPQEREARGAFSNAIANWRKSLSGAQVTGIERVLGADWDPTATSDPKEAIARARRLQVFINRNRQTLGLQSLGGQSQEKTGAPASLSPSALKYLQER
ncbi:MAG: hypothetical protein AAGI11_04385 [Pseudomonadota bacterium]